MLPLRLGAAVWAAGKLAFGGWVVIRLRQRWKLTSIAVFWPALLLVAAYGIQEIRYGNAQLYIVLLAMTAFLVGEERPLEGGFWLGLAAALKVWPLFFYPCLVARRRWRMAAAATASAAGWTLLPVVWRGWGAQMRLLGTWLAQERAIAATSTGLGELWYPGQSLHDVLARYLSVLDYAKLTDARYVQVAWLHLSAPVIERIWLGLALALAVGLLAWLWCCEGEEDGAVALMFGALLVIEPHVHRLILVTLLWPGLWLASQRWRHGLFWLAVGVAAVEPLVPGSARQRWMQVYGVDFWLVLLPVCVCVVWQMALRQTTDSRRTGAGAS
jgi:Glycosyltransferase family 87